MAVGVDASLFRAYPGKAVDEDRGAGSSASSSHPE